MYCELPEDDDVGKVGQRFTKGRDKPGLMVEGASTGKRMLIIKVYSEESKCTRKKQQQQRRTGGRTQGRT